MGRSWRLQRTAAIIAALALLLMVGIANGAPSYLVPQTPAKEVLLKLGADEVSADYVIVVDTSKSMRQQNRYGRVVQALSTFVDTLSPKDHVSLITFDQVARIEYSDAVGKDPRAIARQLPKTPNGDWTDIGGALDLALRELERPGASDVASVILLTDGAHDPPAGSAYPSKSSRTWGALRQRAARMSGRSLNAYGMGLTQDSDTALMKTVFPTAVMVDLPQGQLSNYFARVKEQARLAKAKSILEGDTGSIEASWRIPSGTRNLASGGGDAELILKSTYKYTPVQIVKPAVASAGSLRLRPIELPAEVALNPGESKSIPVRLEWGAPQGFRLGKQTLTRDYTLVATGTVASPWEKAMREDIGVDFAPLLTSAPVAGQVSGEIGTSWLLIGAAAAGALILLFIAWLLLRPDPRPQLKGSYVVDGQERSLSQDAQGGAKLVIGGPGTGSRLELDGLHGDAIVVEALRLRRRGRVETHIVSTEGRVEMREGSDGRWDRFGGGRVPTGAEFRVGSHVIRL